LGEKLGTQGIHYITKTKFLKQTQTQLQKEVERNLGSKSTTKAIEEMNESIIHVKALNSKIKIE